MIIAVQQKLMRHSDIRTTMNLYWILTLLCSAHTANPNTFDWRRSNIEGKEYECAIINRDFGEELCQRQLVEQRSQEHGFMEFWKQLR